MGTLSGAGLISANGGAGGNGFGSGGGGRVAIYYQALAGFDLAEKVTAHGGAGQDGNGAVGTVYLKENSGLGQLLVSSHDTTSGMWTPLGMDTDEVFEVEQFVVAGTNVIAAPQHEMTIQADSLQVANGAVLTHQVTTPTREYSLRLTIASNLLVDASSRIDVSGRGYLGNYAIGNVRTGGATGTSGGSYGGLGFSSGGGTANAVYGDYRNPDELGSGGAGDKARAGAGGGLVRVTASSARIDGAIFANGQAGLNYYQVGGSGSGGAILFNVGTLDGTGRLSADGGNGGGGFGSGGGGRIAIYTWDSMDFTVTNITANGGTGGNGSGQPGTVQLSSSPVFAWADTNAFLHGTEPISWYVLGAAPGTVNVQLSATHAGSFYPIGDSANSIGSLDWNTATGPDGTYTLRAVFSDQSGQAAGAYSREVLVNNSVAWHSGLVTNDQDWTADIVHVVDHRLVIASGVTVTVAPGAVIKFTRGSGITINDGAILNALSTEDSPTAFTSFADDTAGGDSNLDGNNSWPKAGDWAGIGIAGTGQFNQAAYVELRYLSVVHAGTLAASEAWSGTFVHLVNNQLIVPGGVTLTINPGAVVKFAAGAGIKVDSGGKLNAPGTLAQPITFTSLLDDSAGGDSNNDADLTKPAPGDWAGLNIASASATLNHCNIRYGGNTGSGAFASGVIIVNAGSLVLSNSVVESTKYDGLSVYGTGGTATIVNSVLRELDRAIWAWGGGDVHLINCTFDENLVALDQHGGASILAENCIIANSIQASVIEGASTLSYCNLWSKYSGSSNPSVIGQDGNISADPKFMNAAQEDYRLKYGSPCIDSANGAVAPANDSTGAPRYTDPRAKTHAETPSANGSYADMGSFEFVENAASSVDLVARTVVGPSQVNAGDSATIRWEVANIGSGTAVGPWHDSIYLVPVNGGEPLFAGGALAGQGISLGAGQTFSASSPVQVPGGIEGNYRWQVEVNSRGDIFEGAAWTNNTASATDLTYLSVPQLVIGDPLVNGQFTGTGQSLWFKFMPQTNSDVQVNLQCVAPAGSVVVYLGRAYVPSPEHFDAFAVLGSSSAASLIAANASSQPYYVTVYAQSAAGSPLNFNVGTSALDFSLNAVSPDTIGNGGTVTLKIEGGRLREDMNYALADQSGLEHAASSVFVSANAVVYATFNTVSLLPGTYSLMVKDGIKNRSLPNAVSVVPGTPGGLVYSVIMPSFIRWGQVRRVAVNYINPGNLDVLAPMLTVTSSGATLMGMQMESASSIDLGNILGAPATSVQLLGINPEGPAGILPPGFHGTIYFDVMANPGASSVHVNVAEMLRTIPMDWASYKASLKPSFLPDDAWDVVFANFTARLGNSADQYNRVMTDDATYLSRFGEYTVDTGRLLTYELYKANAFGSIGLRYALGALGRGFADPFNMTAQVDPKGNVRIGCPSGFRLFLLQADGSYKSGRGDSAVLTRTADEYRLEEADGVVTVFGASGKIAYLDQPNGFRVTLNYSGTRLTSFSNSYGETLAYTYNAQGRIASMKDSEGRVTDLKYDTSGEHLVSVTDAHGETHIDYITNQGAAREHAISSVAFPDGRHLYFEYDSAGRLTSKYGDQGGARLNYAYDDQSGVTVTDAAGGSATFRFDDWLSIGEIRDALGRVHRLQWDSEANAREIIDPDGNSQAMTYDGQGNLTRIINWLGQSSTLDYNGANSLVRYFNPAGNTVSFSYDKGRSVTGVLYPDQTTLGFTRNGVGDLLAWTNRRGQTVRYSIDAHGQVTHIEFANGSHRDFTYDNHRNLVAAIDETGTNAFAYDAADRLIKATTPSQRSLNYSYDAFGRCTRLATDDGFAIDYSYDAIGRLSTLSDGSGAMIVSYTYDPAGRLAREDKGNGTYTTYEYDLAGQLLHLVHHAHDGSVISRFDYAYDNTGRPTSAATLEGAWTYAYDAADQLTNAVFTSTNPGSVPNQNLSFVYDSAGNRVQVAANGTIDSYQSDNMDRYITAGSSRYSYDADGNLVSITDSAGISTFAYDDFNRLTGATTPNGNWTYEYDAFGFCRAAIHNGQRTEYVVDQRIRGDVIGEYAVGAPSVHYANGIGPVARIESSGPTAYYNYDLIGNTAQLTGPNGAILNQYRYRPFGERISAEETVPNPFAYAGRWGASTDAAGLIRMGARYYQPDEGRFTTEEPVGRRGPNAYAYAYNSPVLYNDPTGLDGQNGFVNWLIGLIPFSSTFTGMQNTWSLGQAGHAQYQANIDALCGNPNAPLYGDSVNGGQVGGSYMPALNSAGQTVFNSQMNVVNQAFSSVQGAPDQFSPLGITQTGISSGLDAMKDHYMNNKNKKLKRKVGGGDGKGNTPGTPPGSPGNGPGGGGGSGSGGSSDPNDLVGPIGYGAEHWIGDDQLMLYTIDFENLPTVSLPAQSVTVDNQLDPNLDWNTFELQQIGFNQLTINVPPGLQSFTTNVNVATDPNPVRVTVAFNPLTGKLNALLESIDPVTGLLVQDPLAGFLPPDDTLMRGQGYITYVIRTKSNITSGARIRNQASIVFDINDPLLTPIATNTVDSGLPSSSVDALPQVVTNTDFLVSWSGSDPGSGIAGYSVYVSADKGPWTLWQLDTTNNSHLYTGLPGHSYSFYSIARDYVGYVEGKTPHAEASTVVSADIVPVIHPTLSGVSGIDGRFHLSFTGSGNLTNIVEVSTNLIDWAEAVALFRANGVFEFDDSAPTNYPARFYRVRVQNP
ncbi:MAG: hypothetical protein M1608_08520 [Candidatus Omnitrophica bacterium]|nr:hypothetical protein [Candidatus Omnitrophota bacterium]